MGQKKPSGIILWEGASILDGAPIVCIATMKTNNKKTGSMVQTWIMRSDMDPVTASKSVMDGSVCGSCPHRHSLGGACYVSIIHAPLTVYRAYKKGNYPHIDDIDGGFEVFKGTKVRFGAYGDPAAVPCEIWDSIWWNAKMTTGYTHQLNHPYFDHRILDFCMVSADTPKAALKANERGARTFRVKTSDAPLLDGEIECLADSEGKTCADCGLCSGAADEGPSIAINVHGSRSRRYETKYHKANIIAIG